MEFKDKVRQVLLTNLQAQPTVSAIWEGGSAANATSDPFSDIDFNIVSDGGEDGVFEVIERSLNAVSRVTHVWNEPKTVWPDLTQKIFFLHQAPKHFFIDVAVFPQSATKILDEFMQAERHGAPVVHFDRLSLLQRRPVDQKEYLEKHRQRLKELLEAFPVYRTNVFKELDRGHTVDAFAFYFNGMVKPLIELLGMIYRPFRFDFGFRYLSRSLPSDL